MADPTPKKRAPPALSGYNQAIGRDTHPIRGKAEFGRRMKKDKVFCNFCANRIEKEFLYGKERHVCKRCNHVYYENPVPVASVIVKRAQEPAKDTWCFPIGFAECGESIEEAALRELKEEAGVDGRITRIIDVMSDATDLYGEVLVVTYQAEKVGGTEIAGDDACDIGYFSPTNLPELAFSSQERALRKFLSLIPGD